ncbi:MAG TPA: hypothetical protein VER08_01575 [Pyrinomonadaceae bacterium]|nr:hypothetical protein [Pyrinomonadaceae bacterium]
MMKTFGHVIQHAALGLLACGALLAAGTSASAQEASASYKRTSRDPFVKYKPPVRRLPKRATPVAVPPIEQRIAMYKALKATAMNLQQPAPKPTTALLVGEVQVTGIFRTPRGYAAMVEATPIKLSYVIYPGEQFFDGQLVAIEEQRLVFRRVTKWTDGRRDVAVDLRPLRQATVADALTAVKPAEAAAPSAAAAPAPQAAAEAAPQRGNQ